MTKTIQSIMIIAGISIMLSISVIPVSALIPDNTIVVCSFNYESMSMREFLTKSNGISLTEDSTDGETTLNCDSNDNSEKHMTHFSQTAQMNILDTGKVTGQIAILMQVDSDNDGKTDYEEQFNGVIAGTASCSIACNIVANVHATSANDELNMVQEFKLDLLSKEPLVANSASNIVLESIDPNLAGQTDGFSMSLQGSIHCDNPKILDEDCGKASAIFDISSIDANLDGSCTGDAQGILHLTDKTTSLSQYQLTNLSSMHYTSDAKGTIHLSGKMIDKDGNIWDFDGQGTSEQTPSAKKISFSFNVDRIEVAFIGNMDGTIYAACEDYIPYYND